MSSTKVAQETADRIREERRGAGTLGQVAEQTAARALVALYDERRNLAAAMAKSDRPTGGMAQAVLDKGTELDAACEAFRLRYYPRKAECFVGLWSVVVASPTRRSVVTVLDLFDQYVPPKSVS